MAPHSNKYRQDQAVFTTAQEQLHEVLSSEQLQETWQQVEQYSGQPSHSPRFWRFFNRAIRRMNMSACSDSSDTLKTDAATLLAQTPAIVVTQYGLSQTTDDTNNVRRMITYGSAIKQFARCHPGVSQQVAEGQMKAFAQSVEIPEAAKQTAPYYVARINRGKQYELAAEKILRASDYEYWLASDEEDLQGYDFIVKAKRSLIFVDITNHADKLRKWGARDKPYAITSRGIAVVALGLSYPDFNDSYFISDELATAKAEEMNTILNEIDQQQTAFLTTRG